MVNIVISPSQQGWNKCAVGDSEQDHTYDICKKLVEFLRGYRCNVTIVPRIEHVGESASLRQVVEVSNNFVRSFGGTGYHLDVHTDAGGGKGASAYYMSDAGKGFVTQIWRELSKLTPWGDGGVNYRSDLYVLNNTIATAGLIELSFHDDVEQAKWIHLNIDLIAQTLGKAIVTATGIEKLEVKEEHWAEKPYVKLVNSGIVINERRFDDNVKRGELFAILSQFV